MAAAVALLDELPDDTRRRLELFVALLLRWQPTINLVASSTVPQVWTRHVADSLQVSAAVPGALLWVDLGSGGGFPGLVTAIGLAGTADARVHLVESDKRKAAFLRAAIRETGAPASVHAKRIEDFVPHHRERVDAVSARALASPSRVVDMARPFLERGAIGVFPQGETPSSELTGLDAARRFRLESVPSRLRSGSSLLIVRAHPSERTEGD